MATSDSEDFESADEWEDGSNISNAVKENLRQDSVAVKPDLELRTNTAIAQTALVTTFDSKGSEEDVKSIEGESCKKKTTSQNGTPLVTDNFLKEFRIQNNIKQYEMHPEGDNAPVILLDSAEVSYKISDGVESKSKELKSCSEFQIDTPVPEIETDGWECEDEDLNEDLIEDNSVKEHNDIDLDKLPESIEKENPNTDDGGNSSWGSWGSWGVTSLLSTATESVSSLTNQVSQGLSTVMETGLGVPDPEELAKQVIEEEKKFPSTKENVEEEKEEENAGLFGFGRVISGVSSITKLVETASTKVVSGGLDTLETIGKKTMAVLQEGDPGLRKKRAIFSEKVVLSQVLREAKDRAELEGKVLQKAEEARKVHFETLFDDYHGLVHLEALEMLSKQCSIKLQSVLLNTPPSDIAERQESIVRIKDLCQVPDEEETEGASFEILETKLSAVGKGLGVPVATEKLIKTWQEINQWLQECRDKQISTIEETETQAENIAPAAQEIHEKAVGVLARLTAEAVEQFHKTAEMLLVYEKRKPTEEALVLLAMTSIFSLQVSTAATVFSENLNTCSEYAVNPDVVNSHITNVFLEAANSTSYIQEAFQLLVPVVQVGVISS